MAAVSEANDVNWWNLIKHKLHKAKCTAMRHPDLICLFVFTFFWLFSKYSKSAATQPVTVTPPPPVTVFPASSRVQDSFTGSLAYLNNQVREEELVVVMFYAPWSVRALETREEFSKAADIMWQQLDFLAVNCWWPSGQCAKKYKFYSYPAIYVYHHRAKRIRYTGPLTAEHLVQFLERVMYPLLPLYTDTHLREFTAAHDPFVLGHFDFHDSPQPPGLVQYYFAALRHIQREPSGPLRFGLIMDRGLASRYNISCAPCAQYNHIDHNINQSFTDSNFTSTNLQLWLSDFAVHRPAVSWLHLPRRKSRHLRDLFKRGPSFLLFLPDNPLYHNHHVTNMQKLLFDYGACDTPDENSTSPHAPALLADRALYLDHFLRRLHHAPTSAPAPTMWSTSSPCKQTRDDHVFCCSSLTLSPNYQRCNVCQSTPKDTCDMSKILSNIHSQSRSSGLSCSEMKYSYNYQHWTSLCCETSHRTPEARTKDANVRQVLHRVKVASCAKFSHSQEKGLPLPRTMQTASSRFYETGGLPGFRGLGCGSNRTFSVSVLDSRLSENLRRRLQLGRRRANGVDVVLVDSKREEHYLLRKPFTRHSMAEFLVNFTRGLLPRAVRSWQLTEYDRCTQDRDCVTEVTQANFQLVVLDERQDVLLLHYSPWCGQCISLFDTYFRLARFFKTCSQLVIARVDGEENDLPWPYTAVSYPTIQIYPAGRKEESVTFPSTVPRTLPNLVKFVLKHASRHLRHQTMSLVCAGPCRNNNRRKIRRFSEESSYELSLLYSRLENSVLSREHKHRAGMNRTYVSDLRRRIVDLEQRLDLGRRLDLLLGAEDPLTVSQLEDLDLR